MLGILNATFMKNILVDGFLSKMKTKEMDLWKMKHGKSVKESLKQFVVEYVGKPIQHALRWVCIIVNSSNPGVSVYGVGKGSLEKNCNLRRHQLIFPTIIHLTKYNVLNYRLYLLTYAQTPICSEFGRKRRKTCISFKAGLNLNAIFPPLN